MVVIFTGQSGLNRLAYLSGLEALAQKQGRKFKIFYVGRMMADEKPAARGRILDLPLAELNLLLKLVFERIQRERLEFEDIAVCMHATFRWKRGLIGGTDYHLFAGLSPDVYVTLLDNVQDVKARLDQNYPNKRYSFRDVMVWREEEILTTSIFSRLTNKPHYLFAVKHPVQTLWKLLFEPCRPRLYASFPISSVIDKPDILAEIEDFKGHIDEEFTVFDPYTISEKKLYYLVQTAKKSGLDTIEAAVLGSDRSIPIAELLPILPDIDDQIVARDLMLVEQSQHVVAYYPCFDDGTPIYSGGREREITYARDIGRNVYMIWQSPRDPGPFEEDAATEIFRSVEQARERLLTILPK